MNGQLVKLYEAAKTFKDAPEANQYLKPVYRAPWKFPE